MTRTIYGWAALALFALGLLPWQQQEAGFFAGEWLAGMWSSEEAASAVLLALQYGRTTYLPMLALPIGAFLIAAVPASGRKKGVALLLLSLASFFWLFIVATAPPSEAAIAAVAAAEGAEATDVALQVGLGWGALLYGAALLALLSVGAVMIGACRGDAFVCGCITLLVALISLFVLFPVLRVLVSAFQSELGYSVQAAYARLTDRNIWSLACVTGAGGATRCGVAINSLFLGLMTAAGTTLMGLAFALVMTRTGFKFKRALRAMTVLPIITPPFVIGLALILLFGRNGTVTEWVSMLTGEPPGRGLYGFYGIWLSQILSFTPIAFLILIGVAEGVSPSVEEASQTLGGSRWQTFWRVSLPLMRPGLANAFLVGFIESLADFGNPMVLGGNYSVLSTEIYFAIVGSQTDAGRAAALGVLLLTFAITAFIAQRKWLGKKSYVTVTGKADNGQHSSLDPRLAWVLGSVVAIWTAFTAILYGMIMVGGFVERWGRDNSFTLRHYKDAFGIDFAENGLQWVGTAWNSLATTLTIAAISAPLTAAIGLLAAWLLVRQRFAGKGALEFATMMSFAIPGTVIGISYILAFNVPPIELTGTAAILVLCFIFRNMPVGLRGGIAAMSQLDRSLDEASTTLGARSFTTARRIILPLMRPALTAALVYSFVRSITSVSAVIFLVSAKYNMATAYIVGLVENGHYGIAIAYSSTLVVVMLVCVLVAQRLVGQRRLRRHSRIQGATEEAAVPGSIIVKKVSA